MIQMSRNRVTICELPLESFLWLISNFKKKHKCQTTKKTTSTKKFARSGNPRLSRENSLQPKNIFGFRAVQQKQNFEHGHKSIQKRAIRKCTITENNTATKPIGQLQSRRKKNSQNTIFYGNTTLEGPIPRPIVKFQYWDPYY